ncbi:IclR family transcription regulator [Natrialba magadii ATCC 43099]|uniref:IclR family transcription regulator n=1 Tax=Natrialba magadii (strain ATCC 43099 / DSM 3394 / CCM 3739 / CIP 104546 / IAM 13178 / JCM 8861 / NBRC 102185 / NCIMB 2190 / MS3) TaxID=547559 RepID=D3SWT5_NATMM|nr:IclR family transcriptional regulator [Natrialba magadii]ADD05817.1 IclR family transcription regulator [Natrialba magadii ATCC 43099]ELY30107.1 IclR family transcriptional regulator [Natrialba magadii ATCC 43099]
MTDWKPGGPEPGDDESTIKSVDTSFAIVTALKERDSAGVTELADATGLSKSSVHKHLRSLLKHDFVVTDGDEYRLGLRYLDLGAHVRAQIPGSSEIKRKLRELAEQAGESAQFAVEERGKAVVLYREVSHGGVYSRGRVGRRFYMHQTAAGKALLSQFSEQWVREIVARHGLPATTPHTITDEDALFEELEEVRERGVAFNSEGSTEGLRSVAVPVSGPDGDVLGAFAVAGPTHRLEGERFETEIPDLLRSIVNELELNLAYS